MVWPIYGFADHIWSDKFLTIYTIYGFDDHIWSVEFWTIYGRSVIYGHPYMITPVTIYGISYMVPIHGRSVTNIKPYGHPYIWYVSPYMIHHIWVTFFIYGWSYGSCIYIWFPYMVVYAMVVFSPIYGCPYMVLRIRNLHMNPIYGYLDNSYMTVHIAMITHIW